MDLDGRSVLREGEAIFMGSSLKWQVLSFKDDCQFGEVCVGKTILLQVMDNATFELVLRHELVHLACWHLFGHMTPDLGGEHLTQTMALISTEIDRFITCNKEIIA